jgi:hypothetical protein
MAKVDERRRLRSSRQSLREERWIKRFGDLRGLACLVALWVICGLPVQAQSQTALTQSATVTLPDAPGTVTASFGSISGTIVDATGAVVTGAKVELLPSDRSSERITTSDDSGQFSFSNVAPGNFSVTVISATFAPQTISGTLHAGEFLSVSQIVLNIATANTDVQVTETQAEVAEDQIKVQETQRLFGAIPNFYVSYDPHAVALNTRQKFELAWKTIIDPVSFVITGGVAGIQQATDQFGGYGQGAAGYGRRYGAAFGDFVIGTVISGAILPSILKQDPRYFYKGTGTKKSRILYAIANSVICKGDNGRWQPAYSNLLGGLAAGGISNLYYPPADRNGLSLTFENFGIGLAGNAAGNIVQEFLLRKFTPHAYDPSKRSATEQPAGQ